MTKILKKKIVWVSSDCFLDHEFPQVEQAVKAFEIHWIIVLPKWKPRYSESDFVEFRHKCPQVALDFFYVNGKFRGLHPSWVIDNYKLGRYIKSVSADLYYFDLALLGLWTQFLWKQIKDLPMIVTAHQGRIHDGFSMKRIATYNHNAVFGSAKYVKMFSESQASLLHKDFPQAKIFVSPLPLIDYGPVHLNPVDGSEPIINFLAFGIIIYQKNTDLLIEAACKVYEKGYRNFKVTIKGKCNNWEFYKAKIKYPEIFDCDIRMIPNEEVADAFAAAHYFVQPYRIVTQSGPMKIAYKYNTPDIASDLPGFTDEIEEGVTGFIFKHEDSDDLARVMMKIIDNHKQDYPSLLKRMKKHVNENFSDEAIGKKYIDMFNSVISEISGKEN